MLHAVSPTATINQGIWLSGSSACLITRRGGQHYDMHHNAGARLDEAWTPL